MNNTKQIKHLFSRAGFGMRFDDLEEFGNKSVKHTVKALIKASETIMPLSSDIENADYSMVAKGDINEKKVFFEKQKQQEKDLNMAWIKQMADTNAVLLEKMTLFWHNHFACRSNVAQYALQLNNIQRSNALGNFRTLLTEVAKSPAMLQFLNNQQNRKGHPNENFARELMELFTIGRGNYTEDDIKESARAFTGYGFDKDGNFVNREKQHDDGQKTFMGKTGNFTGQDIMDALLDKRETAHFICNKLYKYLVNELPDTAHVTEMADAFYAANYEIKPLLEFLFNADWFYDDKNIGNLIKSPVELLVGLNRQFYITYPKPEVMLQFQHVLGQVLFNPPNVAGWPGGRNWIDSSSLMYRLKIPSILLNSGLIDFSGKADPEEEAYIAVARKKQDEVSSKFPAQPNWDKTLKDIPKKTTNSELAAFLLEPPPNSLLINSINEVKDIKTTLIEIVSTPEYQLS